MKLHRVVGSVLVCALATGCATTYVPRPSSRVQVIMKGGTPAYMRDGRVYEGGIFGGDLDEAVRGNSEAESHAKAYQNQLLSGFLATLGGGASMVAGVTLYANGRSQSSMDTTQQNVGAALLIGGLAAYITGLVLLTTAQPHQWDAINIYNDGVPDGPRPPYGVYPAYAPPGPVPPPPASSAVPPPVTPAPRAP